VVATSDGASAWGMASVPAVVAGAHPPSNELAREASMQ
jgi:hypothetical protein